MEVMDLKGTIDPDPKPSQSILNAVSLGTKKTAKAVFCVLYVEKLLRKFWYNRFILLITLRFVGVVNWNG